MDKNGETIYGTDGMGIYADWGTVTRKGNTLFMHILADVMPEVISIPLSQKVTKVSLYEDGVPVNYQYNSKMKCLTVQTSGLKTDIDRILKVELK